MCEGFWEEGFGILVFGLLLSCVMGEGFGLLGFLDMTVQRSGLLRCAGDWRRCAICLRGSVA